MTKPSSPRYNTAPMMDDFKYTPLDGVNPSFRLLRLLKGDASINVECEIFHASVSEQDVVTYEALSYTWGNTELVECITLNGRRLWVTENLLSALQCLRSQEQDRILWIDAICIDQSNDDERSQQVREMGTIFGLARRVIFWLGKPTADAALLLYSLSALHLQSMSYINEHSKTGAVPWKKMWSDIQPTSEQYNDHQVLEQHQRKGLQVLLKRSWFRRVWILQEVARAKAAVVCSGSISVPAHIFAISPMLLGLGTETHVQAILDIMPGPGRMDSWWTRQRDLFTLLSMFRASEATDARDMVFALLGISSEPFDHELLRADYTKPVQEVVHNTIRYWFQGTTISVPQVLDYLAGFKTLHTTYLVSQPRTESVVEQQTEVVHLLRPLTSASSFLKGSIECIKDPALFRLDALPNNESTCYAELDKLQSLLDTESNRPLALHNSAYADYKRGFEIVLWQSRNQNVKFLVIYDPVQAFMIAGVNGCQEVFKFIADVYKDGKLVLLNDALSAASKLGLENVVQLALDNGAEIDAKKSYYDRTALSEACKYGHENTVRMLLDNGASVDSRGTEALLYEASIIGNEKIVQLLLEKGANVSGRGFEGDSLYVASSYGHDKIVQMLLERDADVNAQGRYGDALSGAASAGHETIVQTLLDRGANVNTNGFYGGPLYRACQGGHKRIVRILLDKGADVNLQGGKFVNALHMATCMGHEDIVQLLLDRGANVNALGRYGSALFAASSMGHKGVVQILLSHGSDINVTGKFQDARGGKQLAGTPLQAATSGNHEEIVRMLLHHGAEYEN